MLKIYYWESDDGKRGQKSFQVNLSRFKNFFLIPKKLEN